MINFNDLNIDLQDGIKILGLEEGNEPEWYFDTVYDFIKDTTSYFENIIVYPVSIEITPKEKGNVANVNDLHIEDQVKYNNISKFSFTYEVNKITKDIIIEFCKLHEYKYIPFEKEYFTNKILNSYNITNERIIDQDNVIKQYNYIKIQHYLYNQKSFNIYNITISGLIK